MSFSDNCRNFATKPEGMDPRYDHIIEAAKTNRVPDKERTQYLRAMISDYDKKDIGDAYYDEGFEQGEKKKAREIALNLISMGLSYSDITKATGLTEEEISKIHEDRD